MKRILFPLALVGAFIVSHTQLATAKANQPHINDDSLRHYDVELVEVASTRVKKSSSVAHTNVSKEQIQKNSYGLDIPSLLALTPSMLATNETGIGIGATSVRMRGSDATRLNVTINGMPLNNPDSHSTYWYDTPDLISAVGDMQVQRGAGTSTNGTGAFGGAISMTTAAATTEFGGDVSLSYGSYNTNKQSLHIGSGMMKGGWVVDARLSHIGSDGYVERGATDLKSYLLQGAHYGSRTSVKLLSFGGKAKTNLTYTGATKEEMALYGRRYHTEGQYETPDGPYVLADGTRVNYYDDQTDNYLQINNQLIINHRPNDSWVMNLTGYYTYGYGFYKQYKDDRTLLEYTNLGVADYSIEADIVRRKIMRNHTAGINATAGYTADHLSLLMGGAWSYYTCPHWGEIDWIEGWSNSPIDGRWYDNDVKKQDANLFVKSSWQPLSGLTLSADLQYRYVGYRAWGVNDNFDWNSMQMQPIDIDEKYHFLNPRLGIDYAFSANSNIYLSAAIAHKEPTRSDFTDRYMFSSDDTMPSPERLYDYELGYNFASRSLSLGLNLYYMRYRDQLIPTGMVNDSSDALNVNVPDSYRYGVEMMAALHATQWLTLGGSATWSSNKILNYIDLLADSPTYGQNLGRMTIAYSPDIIASAYADFHYRGAEAVIRTQYIGKQYFTNNEIEALTLDAYTVTNLELAYTLSLRSERKVRFGVNIYNLLNREYCNNGYGYSYMWNGKRYDEAYYFPQAMLHILANVSVKF
ncbi:MAG: TonB-dependent receptor [Alistipes sp.]|nr:TonB-dependent receptor [Alistipes sp.]